MCHYVQPHPSLSTMFSVECVYELSHCDQLLVVYIDDFKEKVDNFPFPFFLIPQQLEISTSRMDMLDTFSDFQIFTGSVIPYKVLVQKSGSVTVGHNIEVGVITTVGFPFSAIGRR